MPGPNSVIVRRASTNSWSRRTVSPGCKSTRRIASIAKRATSRTRPRTSTGSLPKAAGAPITQICKWLGAAACSAIAGGAARAYAAIPSGNTAQTYVEARAAAMNGDHARSAQLLAAIVGSQPDQVDLARKALGEAIGSGQMDLALNLAARIPAAKLPTEARLLLAADEMK